MSPYLFWLDMEMSGLEPESCHILEVASLVTNNDLEIIAEGPCLVVQQSKAVLNAMDDWNTKHHGQSGLTAKVRQSEISVAEAEQQTLAFLRQYFRPKEAILCGNSISQDRRFIRKYMKQLDAYLHYRMLDVSSLKILCQRWYDNNKAARLVKKDAHRALDDIKASVAELQHYRKQFFRPTKKILSPENASSEQR